MAEHVAYTRCWNTSGGNAPTQFLTIADNCPCVQYGGAESTGSNNQVCLVPIAGRVLQEPQRTCGAAAAARRRSF